MKTSEKRENNLSHLAIIMDGNGRWSEQKGLPREDGHKEGVESLRKLLRYIDDFKIPYLTVFSFSTDNWKRPKSEISNLMNWCDYLDSNLSSTRYFQMEHDWKYSEEEDLNQDIRCLSYENYLSTLKLVKDNLKK